jgi:transcriptional regulator with XRE-family HTH domain
MTAKDVFVANLKRLIDHSPMSRRQLADRAGVSYSTLSRWLENGVPAPDGRTKKPLQKICRVCTWGWTNCGPNTASPVTVLSGESPGTVRALGTHLKADSGDAVAIAGRLVQRGARGGAVPRDEPDLAQVVAKVKMLRGDGEIQTYLESLLREWDLSEDDAYRRLIETTQRFLAAALPQDPEQLGQWFIEAHPRAGLG